MRFTTLISLAILSATTLAEEWTVDHPQPVEWTEEHGEWEDFLLQNSHTVAPLRQHQPSLHKRSDGSVNLDVLKANLAIAANKYEVNTNIIKLNGGLLANPISRLNRNKKRQGSTIALKTPQAGVWSALVQLGTPLQSFQVYLDTGSTDLTIAGSDCTSCGSKARYDPSASSTSNDRGITVGSGFVTGTASRGEAYTDVVKLGSFTAPAPYQTFISASNLSSTLNPLPVDGIMGMAFPNLAALKTNSTPFTIAAHGGSGAYFALRLSDTAGLSYLSMGVLPKTRLKMPLYQYLNYADQPAFTYWQVRLSAPNVNGNVAVTNRATHILDSGTNYIIAPTAGAADFWSHVPGSQQYNTNFWTFPCANPPNVSITLFRRTVSFAIDPDDFNLGYLTSDPSRCVGGVVGVNLALPDSSAWILGQVFMKSWLTAFYMGSVPNISIVKYRDRGTVISSK